MVLFDGGEVMEGLPGVSVRRVGELTAAVCSSGEMHGVECRGERAFWGGFTSSQDWITEDTNVGPDGTAIFGINWLYLDTPGGGICIDPSTFERDATLPAVTLVPGVEIERALESLGTTPDQIAHVIITHGHDDHFNALVDPRGGGPRFTAAVHHFPAADWQAFVERDERGTRAALLDHLGPVRDAGLLQLTEGDSSIVEGVRLIHAPGESPGHSVVQADSAGQRLVYLGDLVHVPVELRHISWIVFANRDVEAMVSARRRAFAASEDALVVYTHAAFPAWGHVLPTRPDVWRWRALDT